MSTVLSIDAGIETSGFAWWIDGVLDRAGYCHQKDHSEPIGDRISFMVYDLFLFANQDKADTLVIEQPGIWGRGVRPDSIVKLAMLVGAFTQGGRRIVVIPTRTITKAVTFERCQRDLSKEELSRVKLPPQKGLQHNVWDGLALGLLWLKKEGLR